MRTVAPMRLALAAITEEEEERRRQRQKKRRWQIEKMTKKRATPNRKPSPLLVLFGPQRLRRILPRVGSEAWLLCASSPPRRPQRGGPTRLPLMKKTNVIAIIMLVTMMMAMTAMAATVLPLIRPFLLPCSLEEEGRPPQPLPQIRLLRGLQSPAVTPSRPMPLRRRLYPRSRVSTTTMATPIHFSSTCALQVRQRRRVLSRSQQPPLQPLQRSSPPAAQRPPSAGTSAPA